MDKKHRYPTAKDAALHQLGVVSKKSRTKASGLVESVQVSAGRQLLARGAFAPTVLVGVTGSVMISDGDGNITQVPAPFVIDSWAARNRRIADVTVVAESDVHLLLIDWRHRDAVVALIPALKTLSVQTHHSVEAATQLIDLTEAAPQPQPIN